MENKRRIIDTNLENVSGAGGQDEGFKIEVQYDIWGKNDATIEHYEMTYYVEPGETIGNIEDRTWKHSHAEGANCQTFYRGALVPRDTTIRNLGIRPYEILKMTVEAWGHGW